MLDQPVTALPGVGVEKAKILAKLDLYSVRDVLFGYPRSYKDYSKIYTADHARQGMEGLFTGTVVNLREQLLNQNKRLIQAQIQGNTQSLTVSWFQVMRGRGTSYLYRQLSKVDQIWIYGQIKEGPYSWELTSGEWHTKQPKHLGLVPVYPLVSGITNTMRLQWIDFALKYLDQIYECLPKQLLAEFYPRTKAIHAIHFPTDDGELLEARKRLIFEEFFLFHLSLGKQEEQKNAIQHKPDGKCLEQYFNTLPFTLTAGQLQAICDVRADMEAPIQMRRLIQGDVGSGKTVIAEYATLKAVDSGGQVAFLVPTEVLARQMWTRLRERFSSFGIEVELLVGKDTTKHQKKILSGLAQGTIAVVVGTHALIADRVVFANLTLAIVDEQHRFGVRQRIALSDKGNADLLVMSATPIPRSLALTLYGDLNNTIIRDLPAGRRIVDTRLIHPSKRQDVYRFLVGRVEEKEQGFVVFALVEESDKLDLKAAVTEMEVLSAGPLSSIRVGLVHGQMGKQKAECLELFYQQKIDVLVSTTVIEVGMNVPTATVIVVENADRFGLAQLHQLRGRVGRSKKQAYCFLIANPQSEIARQRLDIIRHTNDGLRIAEEDLKLRGPGDLLGTRQSGQPWFKLADLIADAELLEKAAKAGRMLILEDPTLAKYPTLLAEVKRQQP